MKQLTVFILLLCLYSCDYFDKKKVNSQDIVNEELQTFNWNDVDEYPSFKTCESLSSKQESKQCFETTLITHITNKLSDEIIVVTENVEDTVMIKFHISEAIAIYTSCLYTYIYYRIVKKLAYFRRKYQEGEFLRRKYDRSV